MTGLLGCAPDVELSPPPAETGATSSTSTLVTGRLVGRFPPEAPDLDPAPDVLHVALTASIGAMFDHSVTWAYERTVPGPTLRARVGDTLVVDLHSDLPDDTSIHWHGVHLPWDQDGIEWIQTSVPPGGDRTYTFPLDRAGTYWYHPHFDSAGQVDAGLYGMLVVEDPAEPMPDADWVWVFDVLDEALEDTGSATDHAHGSATASPPWVVNRGVDPEFTVAGGSVLRVRVLNASNTGYLHLDWPGARAIGGDQGLWAAPSDTLPVLAPGDRLVVEFRPAEAPVDVLALPVSLFGGPSPLDTARRVATIRPDPPGPEGAQLSWPFSGAAPAQDGPADLVFTLSGDGEDWRINQQTWPDVTIPEVPLGTEVVVEVRNLSGARHPWHLHGLPFEVLSVDGVSLTTRTTEDTFDVDIRQTVRTRITADLAGDWMAHCHILPHAHGGMMTVIRVQ